MPGERPERTLPLRMKKCVHLFDEKVLCVECEFCSRPILSPIPSRSWRLPTD